MRFGQYFEPFLGGGALFFSIVEEAGPDSPVSWSGKAFLSDSNSELINTYRTLRDTPSHLIAELERLAGNYNASTDKDRWYKECRKAFNLQDPNNTTDTKQAARFIFLNKCGFNGLYRVNKRGDFNVPWGKRETFEPDARGLEAASQALRGTALVTEDFESAVEDAQKGDFVYFDPPYVPVSATSDFTAYQKEPFGPAEQARLRECAIRLKNRGVYVLLSNSDTPLVHKMYRSLFMIERVTARRSVNSKGGSRGPVGEVLIT
jgi:DNA adenine methylase